MRHFGDITNLRGYDMPIVDCITGGSPCQDLSVAKTNRVGLNGQRSGLFMEQIRIVKEMREHDRTANKHVGYRIRPRYMVWENVPGALSSNNRKDFQAVLEETARIADPNANVPGLEEKQKWANAGCIMGNGWSIAWRVHDAQFWGVPQRRRRISLVGDFGGQTAPEILFERKGLHWDPEEDAKNGKDPATPVRAGTKDARKQLIMLELGSTKHTIITNGICPTLKARMGTGGNNVNAVVQDGHIRKLTPLEVERLQGYPDGWTDIGNWVDTKGKTHKLADSPRYKALGNSIATPFWFWLLRRISAQYERPATLGSLFDGIGGFPYCWERCNGKGTALWASEIEEFAIAVTKYHFPE